MKRRKGVSNQATQGRVYIIMDADLLGAKEAAFGVAHRWRLAYMPRSYEQHSRFADKGPLP